MADKRWMIYGAYGYTGTLIVQEALRAGLNPVLAGRAEDRLQALAAKVGCSYRAFDLADTDATAERLQGMHLVLHCAGPFSATAAPMLEGCFASGSHYLDITGEIDVFEHVFAQQERARTAGLVLCPGVGFDVIPTDCVAARLREAMPDASRLALGFESRSGMAPGTAKTAVEMLARGNRIRENGKIRKVGFAHHVREIDFGAGSRTAMTIPWGDIATGWRTTGIPNIECYVPAPRGTIRRLRLLNTLRPLLGLAPVQHFLKHRIERRVRGPGRDSLERLQTFVWGEALNDAGERRVARIRTANGYRVTACGAVAMVKHLLRETPAGGAYTPSRLAGADLVERLPGSDTLVIGHR